MRALLTGVAIFFAASLAFANREVQHDFHTAVPATGIRRVVIEIPVGEVTIRNGAAGQIVLNGTAKREYDGTDPREKNQRIVDDVRADIYVNREEAVIRRRFGPNAEGFRGEHFTTFTIVLEVPPGVSLDIETRVGELTIDGTFGDVDADLRAGEIRVTTPRAAVKELNASCRIGEVRANLGNQVIEREGVFPRTTHFENPTGHSRINVHTTVGEVTVTLTP